MILDYLSPVDRVYLALCCHRLMNIVTRCGGKPLKGMLACEWGAEPDSEISRFLARLSEDLPEYYNCCNCIQLYLWRNIPHPGSFQFDRICYKPGLNTRHWGGTNAAVWQLRDTRYRLDVAHVQTATRRHLHETQYGNSVDSLSYTDVRVPDLYGWDSPERSIFFQHHATQVTSIDARIFPNTARLCLRVQSLRIGREEFLEENTRMMPSQNGDISYRGTSVCTSNVSPSSLQPLRLVVRGRAHQNIPKFPSRWKANLWPPAMIAQYTALSKFAD
jgi:hypothetical protein